MCSKTIILNCIHLSGPVSQVFRLHGLMKTERHQFNYNVLASYRVEFVFIWSPNEFLIRLLLTLCYHGVKWESSQLLGFVLTDGQVFVPLFREKYLMIMVRGKNIFRPSTTKHFQHHVKWNEYVPFLVKIPLLKPAICAAIVTTRPSIAQTFSER